MIIFDAKAMVHLDKIEIIKIAERVSTIVISPKEWMAVPPILESLDGYIFDTPTRGEKYDFIYKRIQTEGIRKQEKDENGKPVWVDVNDSKSINRKFRIQLVPQ